jgi:hypothetical protein
MSFRALFQFNVQALSDQPANGFTQPKGQFCITTFELAAEEPGIAAPHAA